MAFPLPEEALRALQNTVSIHEVIFPKYATVATLSPAGPAHIHTYCEKFGDVVQIRPGGFRLAGMLAICYQADMEVAVLV